MLNEIKEMVHRNLGNTFDTELILNQLIQIFSILQKEENIEQPYILMYKTLAFHMQLLKTDLQKENKLYEREKAILKELNKKNDKEIKHTF